MLPLNFFKSRAFSMANLASLLMYFGMFGAIFLLSQFLQVVQGFSPFQAGLRLLPWTLAPMFVAPIAGASSDKVGGGLLMGVGLTMQAIGLAWLGVVITPGVDYAQLVLPFIISGIGMGLFFAPVANVVLSAVRPHEEGQASGANNAIREVGGVFGVAVLASVFSANGGYGTPQTFVDGLEAGHLHRGCVRVRRRARLVRHPQAAADARSVPGAGGVPHRRRRTGAGRGFLTAAVGCEPDQTRYR